MAFGISLNIEKNDLPYVAFVGSICFSTRKFFSIAFSSSIFGTFIAALVISFLSIFLSKQRQKPMSVFLASGILSILPGYSIFKMLLGFVKHNSNEIIIYGIKSIQILIIIAISAIIASSISKIIDYAIKK